MKKLLLSMSAFAAFTVAPATAHVVMEKWEAYAGFQTFMTLAVPHGCGLAPTTEVRIKVPDGIGVIAPAPEAGWKLSLVRKKLDQPRPGEGGRMITEVVDEIVWTGGSLPTDQLGRFHFLALMPNTPGKVMYFKTIQKCSEGETKWVDTVADGEPLWKVWAQPAPSPFVELKAAPGPQLGATMQEIGAERKKLGKPSGPQ